ncbi:MAG: RHS repeat-associated core domain-containing protein [Chloroflexota bacterium]
MSTAHFTGTTADSLTAYYFGGAYEVTGSTIRKYYGFAGQTIAVRECTGGTCSAPAYFLTDHLGSIVAVTDASGTLTSQQRYLPFGEVRTDVGAIGQTDYGYTGQRNNTYIKLLDYDFRWYSPQLARFISPDSIIPDFGNPQSLNRFGYVLNNPIRYNDPTGHDACDEDGNCYNQNGKYRSRNRKDWSMTRVIHEDSSEDQQTTTNSAQTQEDINICEGNPPYQSQYICGVEFTDPGYILPSAGTNPVVGNDTFTDFYWPGKIEENKSSASRAVNAFFLGLDAFYWLYYNTEMQGHLSGEHTLAAIPYAHDRDTNYTVVPGLFVINRTSSNLAVRSMSVNDQVYRFEGNVIAPDTAAAYALPTIYLSPYGSVNIKIVVSNSTGNGTISYSGSVYSP